MKYDKDRIKPLDSYRREKFIGSAPRLIEAQHKQSRSYHEHPIQRDMFAEYDAIAAWGIVTSCYSGIEQAMKCLLQMRDAYIDKSLCKACYKRVQGKGSEECRNVKKCGYKKHYEELFQAQSDFAHSLDDRRNHRHHDIGKLFRALACEEQDVLRVSYGTYRSLHDYIPPETADCFLDAIDSGYPTWRYFLLEGEMPPSTHPGAMLEIWAALCDILGARVFTNHGLNSVEKRIGHNLSQNALQDAWVAHIDADIGQREIDDINHWIKTRHSNVAMNAYIDFFNQHTERSLHLIEVLPSTRALLNSMVGIVKEKRFDNDIDHFLRRAQMGDIAWNPDTRLFEKISRTKEIEIKVIESDHSYFEDAILGPSVKVDFVESVPDCIQDFIFELRTEGEIVNDNWSIENARWNARLEFFEERKARIREYDGGIECEGYRCFIDGMELVIILYDSKEWIIYRYHNKNIPGVPHHCKNVKGKVRSIRESIRAIEHWRRTEKKAFETLRNSVWRRRGKRRSDA